MNADRNTRLVVGLTSLVFAMLALSFAAVPLYNWFYKITGFGGVTQAVSTKNTKVLRQEIEIRFEGSLEAGMPWQFKPLQKTMKLKIGETGLAFYEAYNPTDKVIFGTASFNVFPYSAGGYFTKIDCFCFTMQVLQPGERVKMPVTFNVDAGLVNDTEAKYAKTITLSYTFHVTDLPEEQASLAIEGQNNIKTLQ